MTWRLMKCYFLFKFWGIHNVCLEFSDQSVTVCCIKATCIFCLWKVTVVIKKLSIFSIQIETVTLWSTTWFTSHCYATLTVKQCTPWKRVSKLHMMIPVMSQGVPTSLKSHHYTTSSSSYLQWILRSYLNSLYTWNLEIPIILY